MSNLMHSRSQAEYDGSASAELADDITVAGATTELSAGVPLGRAANWESQGGGNVVGDIALGGRFLTLNVHVSAVEAGNYTFELVVDDDPELATANAVASFTLDEGEGLNAGLYRVGVDGRTIQQLRSNATHVGVRMTSSGDTPEISYSAWLTTL